MNGRAMVRLPLVFALVFGMMFLGGAEVQAQQTPTEKVASCIDNAADKFAECTGDSGFWGDLGCGIKYIADAILCLPSMILNAV